MAVIYDLTKRTGGDANAVARSIIERTITSYEDNSLLLLKGSQIYGALKDQSTLTTLNCKNVTAIGDYALSGTRITSAVFPSVKSIGQQAFTLNPSLLAADFGKGLATIKNATFRNSTAFATLILRKSDAIVTLGANVFNGTPFASGGTGGTIYIPKALYNHLGDGTALDYKAATNWSAVDGYGTITWAKIEGSIYETQYADGTPIPAS